MGKTRLVLNSTQIDIIVTRLCYQLIENHNDFSNSVLIGIQPRGIYLAKLIKTRLEEILSGKTINLGSLDATFFRDDFRRRDNVLLPNKTLIDFIIENKKVVLIDDVLFTGRTIRASLDAMQAFGRPDLVELLVLVDRRFSRHLPIQPLYVGTTVDAIESERVEASWEETDGENKVVLN